MPKAGRLSDIASGHGGFPPSPTIEGSDDVFINTRPALRKGDTVAKHPHKRNVAAGSATVNINTKPAARVGDEISCGGFVSTGSENVFIGDDTWWSGTGEVKPTVRFVISQVPGSTDHGYYKEPYKLYHNGSLVQEGLTDENGVIEFEPDQISGEFLIKAVNAKWTLEVRGLAPADTDAGVTDRLQAFCYHCSDDIVEKPNDAVREEIRTSLGWFQNDRKEANETAATDRIKDLLKALIP